MVQYYTYIYKDPFRNMEAFYVGKGSGKRSYKHLQKTKRKLHFHNRVQKMLRESNKPEIEIINTTCEFAALWLEKVLIKAFGRKDLGTGALLNMTDGGENPPSSKGKKRPAQSKRMKENNPMKLIRVHSGTFKSGKDHLMFGKTGENSPNFGKQEVVTCHCGESGGVSNMKRYHLSNCKNII